MWVAPSSGCRNTRRLKKALPACLRSGKFISSLLHFCPHLLSAAFQCGLKARGAPGTVQALSARLGLLRAPPHRWSSFLTLSVCSYRWLWPNPYGRQSNKVPGDILSSCQFSSSREPSLTHRVDIRGIMRNFLQQLSISKQTKCKKLEKVGGGKR